jgi:bifunctional DNA-binding transcriptional regulator/antitoxin component of YhaV-PrlF toxin-antitoxin module
MSAEETKTFVVRVQKEGRIQIPEPVRSVMGLAEDDIVEVTIKKLKEEKKVEGGGASKAV